jgi:hypothetical protein
VELASNGRGLSFRFRLNEDTLWGDALPSHHKGTDPILTCLRASTGEHKARPIIPSVPGFGCRLKKSNEGDLAYRLRPQVTVDEAA